MNHPCPDNKETATAVAASVSSVLLSVIASSHHGLHMGILLLLGGSTNMMAAMSGMIWVRRAMILMTVLTTIYALYRMNARRHMPIWMKGMTSISAAVSIGFVVFTLSQFGW